MRWERRPLKHVAAVSVSNVDKKSVEAELPVRLVNYTDVYYGDRLTPDLDLMTATASPRQREAFHLEQGDVVITKDSETADDIGIAAYVERTAPDMVCGYHLAILRPLRDRIDGRFLYWAMKSDDTLGQLSVGATGVTRYGLRTEVIASTEIAVPSLPEQRAIADYLDTETVRIDTLITKKRRLIESLDDKVESEVDKVLLGAGGADPQARLDGEWTELLPDGWLSVPVKHLARCDNSGAWGDEPGDADHDLPVATTAQISARGEFDIGKMAERSFSSAEVHRYVCRLNDIVVVKSSGSATNIVSGKAGIVRSAVQPFVFSNFLMRLSPDIGVVEPEFLYLFLTSHLTRQRIERMVSATTYPNLQVGQYLSASVPLPPLNEQRVILDRLRGVADSVHQAASKEESSIRLLHERREALITAAVTGEATVSGVAA